MYATGSTNLLISDLTFVNSPNHNLELFSNNVEMSNVKVRSRRFCVPPRLARDASGTGQVLQLARCRSRTCTCPLPCVRDEYSCTPCFIILTLTQHAGPARGLSVLSAIRPPPQPRGCKRLPLEPLLHALTCACHDLQILAPPSPVSHNTDGVDIHGAPFHIHDCHIDTGDDNIAAHANDSLIEVRLRPCWPGGMHEGKD